MVQIKRVSLIKACHLGEICTKWWFCDESVPRFNQHTQMVSFLQIKQLPDKKTPGPIWGAHYAIRGLHWISELRVTITPTLQLYIKFLVPISILSTTVQSNPQVDKIVAGLRNHNSLFLLAEAFTKIFIPLKKLPITLVACRIKHWRKDTYSKLNV